MYRRSQIHTKMKEEMTLQANTLYVAHYQIVVKAPDHHGCLTAYNRFKALVNAFNVGQFHIHETKSARKGDVLEREIQITHEAYADDVIFFRTGIDKILQLMRIRFHSITVELIHANAHRKDAAFDGIE